MKQRKPLNRRKRKLLRYLERLPTGIFCIGHDISELRQASDELDQMKINHSNSVRIHVANLIGLGNLIQLSNAVEDIEEAAKLIVQSAKELDVVVRELHAA